MNNKGFSLIEVLISLVILAIGLLAIAGMQITAIKGNYFSSSLTQATILAQDKMEELKNITYANVSSNSDTKPVSGTTFTRQWNVAEDAGNSIKTITVTVQWTDKVSHSIALSTIRAK